MSPSRDYYADLELPPTADIQEIKRQFRKLGKATCLAGNELTLTNTKLSDITPIETLAKSRKSMPSFKSFSAPTKFSAIRSKRPDMMRRSAAHPDTQLVLG